MHPSGIAMYYASYHAKKFYTIALFVASSLFGPTNSKVSFRFLGFGEL